MIFYKLDLSPDFGYWKAQTRTLTCNPQEEELNLNVLYLPHPNSNWNFGVKIALLKKIYHFRRKCSSILGLLHR